MCHFVRVIRTQLQTGVWSPPPGTREEGVRWNAKPSNTVSLIHEEQTLMTAEDIVKDTVEA